MNIYCWEGYNQKKFIKDFPYKINLRNFISDFHVANQIKNKKINCDVININNAFIRDYLWKKNLIKELDYSKYYDHISFFLKNFKYLSKWTLSYNKKKVIGIGQRFGNLNFVINSNLIKKNTSELEGYNLIIENKNKFGILLFEDFNIMQIALSGGINPFKKLNDKEISSFTNNCQLWFENAKLISNNYLKLNKLLIKKQIRFYLTGGTYTCSTARREGNYNIMSIIPKKKINKLKQGLIFTEITSVLINSKVNAEKYLDFILTDQKSYEIAMSKYTCNPVLQMGNPKILNRFSKSDLEIIQFDNLDDSKFHSFEYQIIPNYKKLLGIFKKTLSLYTHKII